MGAAPSDASMGRAQCRPLLVTRVCRLPRTGSWSMHLFKEGFGDGSDHESSSHCGMYRSFSVRLSEGPGQGLECGRSGHVVECRPLDRWTRFTPRVTMGRGLDPACPGPRPRPRHGSRALDRVGTGDGATDGGGAASVDPARGQRRARPMQCHARRLVRIDHAAVGHLGSRARHLEGWLRLDPRLVGPLDRHARAA